MKNNKQEVTCTKCGYKWGSRTLLQAITCPNCMNRFSLPSLEQALAKIRKDLPTNNLNQKGG